MEVSQLKILSWNVNGLKSIISGSLKEFLDNLGAEILCFQETKTTRDQLDEATANVEGYTSYFSFSKRRSGYSGVVTFCKDSARPYAAEEGLTGVLSSGTEDGIGDYGDVKSLMESDVLQSVDAEGRAVLTKHKLKLEEESKEEDVVIINVYCPRADPERADRKEYKLQFYEVLEHRARAILDTGCHVIVLGDINTCHRPMDCCEKDIKDFDSQPSRVWIDNFIFDSEKKNGGAFVDTFRHFHPQREKAFTCWCTRTNARENNFGQRIDYIFADAKLNEKALVDCVIMPEVLGSDHCPVAATLRGRILPARKLPALCSRNWPEFSGKQSTLSNFVRRISKEADSSELQNGKRKLLEGSLKQCSGMKSKQAKLDVFFTKKMDSAKDAELVPSKSQVPEGAKSMVSAWSCILKGPPPAPLCKGHKEAAALRVCKKAGANFKRQFYACAKPAGSDPENSNCNFFQWVNNNNKSK